MLSLEPGTIQATSHDIEPADQFDVDRVVSEVSVDDYDALILPASYPSIRTDIRNAGGTVLDQEVVIDGNIVSSRQPDDLPAFCRAIVAAFAAVGTSS